MRTSRHQPMPKQPQASRTTATSKVQFNGTPSAVIWASTNGGGPVVSRPGWVFGTSVRAAFSGNQGSFWGNTLAMDRALQCSNSHSQLLKASAGTIRRRRVSAPQHAGAAPSLWVSACRLVRHDWDRQLGVFLLLTAAPALSSEFVRLLEEPQRLVSAANVRGVPCNP